MLLLNSRLKLFLNKLKLRWSRPFTINKVTPFGAVKLVGHDGRIFSVNGKRLKPFTVKEERRVECILLDEPK